MWIFWYLSCLCYLSFLVPSVGACHQFGNFSALLLHFFCSLLTFIFCYSDYLYTAPFVAIPHFWKFLGYSAPFFHSFSFTFQFGKFLLLTFKLTDPFFSHVLLKGIPFSICCCVWSSFSIRSLNIVIVVVFNFLSDNSKIYVMCEFGSDPCFLYSGSDLSCLLVCLVIFLLKAEYDEFGN